MIVFLTTADTEIATAAAAVSALPADFPSVRCANPADPELSSWLDEALTGARVVLVRLLGGRRAWPEGFAELERRLKRGGVPLLAFGGEHEAEAELTAASTVPDGVVAQAFEYMRQGGVDNMTQLFRFVADTVLLEGFGFAPPVTVPDVGIYLPGRGDVGLGEAMREHSTSRPTVGIVFYRTHRISGNTAFVDALAHELDAAGANVLCVWCYSLRPDARGRVEALDLLRGHVDAVITTVLASGGSNAADALPAGDERPADWMDWDASALAELDVSVLQAVCATVSRSQWSQSDSGLPPLDAAMQVAIPEFDGRVIAGVVCFKERFTDQTPVGGAVAWYVADRERTRRVAKLAVRHARLRRIPTGDRRVAIVLSSYPTRHARVGNAVGLDTPQSAVMLLEALRDAGYSVDAQFESSDELIHALIETGGHDQEFLTEAQLARADTRLDREAYSAWFDALPEELRTEVVAKWGEPPGDLYVDADDIVVAGLELGNVFLAIQPPRGFGDNPVAIYHDPELAPTHHYLAAYWWLDQVFGADAVVHLGKHGTLEWLPGKALGLSSACAPDAALGSLPLLYPFVVNDPGEGEQAKRRAHAVIVDHLVPPMMRAETYDELAALEQLLDDYAQAESLDPGKLPAIRGRIWELIREAALDRDLGVREQPADFSELVTQLDGYLCEIKDMQIRDGLHVLGVAPQGKQRLGLVAAILRLGTGTTPGLRRAIAARYGLDETRLLQDPGAPASAPAGLADGFGQAATGAEVIDRLESAQQALLTALDARDFDPDAATQIAAELLGMPDAGVIAALDFACRYVVPRLDQTANELTNLVGALDGRHVPSGPSGSPTRGLANVLPTGRNFYSVDPKALPSELSYETGRSLADALLRRHLTEQSRYPETVGIVVWGTAAMRTQGDDVAEILALLGVRPVWNPESRRVVGLEVIDLAELGRPRIDVTVRISGFFRDAFSNLIDLLDEAVAKVSALAEPDEHNFVKKHARADSARLAQELSGQAAWRRATTRIFGSKPGAYGAGLLPLLDAGNWRTDADLAQVYEVWGGYAYGRGLGGTEAREAMRDNFARIEVAVKNVDTREHDIFDSDDFFQYHGGMVAAVRALSGTDPAAYIGDSADPAHVQTRGLDQEARRVFRARVENPRWIDSMRRHGYKGAFELSATVDYLFGYDATAGVVDDWMYEAIARKYALADEAQQFMRESNPWALRAITERLLEAAQRGLWHSPEESTLAQLHDMYLGLEGELEERQA